MTIEEKAKAYDEAIKRARKIKNGEPIDIPDGTPIPVAIFPELKESESDNILNCIRICLTDANEQRFKDYKTSLKDCLAWLEKQGNLVKYYEDKLDRCACNNFNKGYKKALEKQGENEDKDIETKLNHAHFEGEIEGRDKVLSNLEKYGLQKIADKVEPNPTWSEEDAMQFDAAINIVANSGHTCTSDWLKSLKDRYTWKPSDFQIECLSDAIKHYNSQGYTAPVLKELLEQLKKLKED